MSQDNPFAKLGALDQKLFEETSPKPHGDGIESTSKPTSVAPQKKVTKNADASMQASKQASSNASKQASILSLSNDSLEIVRKVVKNPGKEEVLYVRLTKEEKDALADVSYTYKRQGIRTSDNEVVRVAINALLEDYKINGANSLLVLVISSLHD